MDAQKIVDAFYGQFQHEPLIVIRSPGRVNLIGEHTDYNEGFALPAAIDRAVLVAMAPNNVQKIRLVASDMGPVLYETEMDHLFKSDLQWPDYALGIVDQLIKSGRKIDGFDCMFGGNLPIGAGLSSSAALEGGIIFGLSSLFNLEMSRMEMALSGRKAENEFVGIQCGIMDQFANLYGKKECVIRLDCRSLHFDLFPFKQEDVSIMLCDTGVRRELAFSEYNIRRNQCGEGVKYLQKADSSVMSLRDVHIDLLADVRESLDPVVFQRCRFILDENQRVLSACEDLEKGDLFSFGRKMYLSHYGLRDQYDVSCGELDMLVDATENMDGVLGSRMMGGGFGGCTINLVVSDDVKRIESSLKAVYKEQAQKKLDVHIVSIDDGTERI